MNRRNPFEGKAGAEPAAYIPGPASKAKRNREWERKRAGQLAAYRGIPQDLQESVKAVAAELGVPVGDVARMLLEAGLEAYRAGTLKANPTMTGGKRRLFSE